MVKMRDDERYEVQRKGLNLVGKRVLFGRVLRDIDMVEEISVESSHAGAGGYANCSSNIQSSESGWEVEVGEYAIKTPYQAPELIYRGGAVSRSPQWTWICYVISLVGLSICAFTFWALSLLQFRATIKHIRFTSIHSKQSEYFVRGLSGRIVPQMCLEHGSCRIHWPSHSRHSRISPQCSSTGRRG